MKRIVIFYLVLSLFGCKNKASSKVNIELSAIEIVNKAIVVAGGDNFKRSKIFFDFRDKHYTAQRINKQFSFTRFQIDNDKDSILDILNNESFERYINNNRVTLVDSMISKYSASVNSVHYFSVLPFGLNDRAVNKKLIGEEHIQGKDYYKIEVTFDEIGGGEDYDDKFIYWINKVDFKVDFLAYSYIEDDGRGLRFREAINERYISGLRFVDYNNYKPSNTNTTLEALAKSFEKNNLNLVSMIELNNISVELIDL